MSGNSSNEQLVLGLLAQRRQQRQGASQSLGGESHVRDTHPHAYQDQAASARSGLREEQVGRIHQLLNERQSASARRGESAPGNLRAAVMEHLGDEPGQQQLSISERLDQSLTAREVMDVSLRMPSSAVRAGAAHVSVPVSNPYPGADTFSMHQRRALGGATHLASTNSNSSNSSSFVFGSPSASSVPAPTAARETPRMGTPKGSSISLNQDLGLSLLGPDMDLESDALLASVNAQLNQVAERLGLMGQAVSTPPAITARVAPDSVTKQALRHVSAGPPASSQKDKKRASSPSAPWSSHAKKTVEEAPSSSPPAASQQRSLAELELMLNKTMTTMTFNADPRSATANDGGPFDISELWTAASPETPVSAEPSEGSSYGTGGLSLTLSSGGAKPKSQAKQQDGMAYGFSKNISSKQQAQGGKAQPVPSWGWKSTSKAIPPQSQQKKTPQKSASQRQLPTRPASAPRQMPSQRLNASPNPVVPGSPPESFSFKPSINAKSRRMIESNPSYPSATAARLNQLSVPRSLQQATKHAKIRRDLEEEELKECTFRPQTGRGPSTERVRPSAPVHERLYQPQPAWLSKRDAELKARQEAALAQCTFQPVTNHSISLSRSHSPQGGSRVSDQVQRAKGKMSTGVNSQLPLYERVGEVLRERSERLANARINTELAGEGLSFKPKINKRSVALALEREAREQEQIEEMLGGDGLQQQPVGPGERLYLRAMVKARVSADLCDIKNSADQECTFAPSINERSRAMMEGSGKLPSSFLERQAHLAAQAAERRSVFRSMVESSECTFKPDLGASSGSGSDGPYRGDYDYDSPRTPSERQGNRLTKLAYQDVRRSAALKEALDQHYYGSISFSPEINPKSRALARRHSVDELHKGESQGRNRHGRCIAVSTAIEREAEECRFRPVINPRSAAIVQKVRSLPGARPSSLLDSVGICLDQQKAKAQRLEQARAAKEYEELKECTFAPEVNKRAPPPAQSKPVVPLLAGVSRHLELLAIARRKQEEQKKVQDKVWWRTPRGNKELFTVPQPFSFQRDHDQLRDQGNLHQDDTNNRGG